MPERIGVLGGTFDPVHRGHLEVARQVRETLGLDLVLLMPVAAPPHRPAPLTAPADRLALIRAAVEGEPGLEAGDLEVLRGGVSYTAETLRELAAAHPGAELFLLLGWDAARDFASWREPEAIAALARLVVFNRSGADMDAAGSPPAAAEVRRRATAAPATPAADPATSAASDLDPSHAAINRAGLPGSTILLEVDSPAVSATRLRAELASGGDGGGALPASVLRLLRERGLYSEAPRPPGTSVS
ncbi:MAG TPA: nicotinate (nicotinamide) nucleotide adenylyltransferase [Candidatus Dormibacteraeota bacterium]|jgi:nicotinate-nucleotide adenylyltransferase|nr:nicotinate (nicotinamide) nucleotide adenylyltransferase [Candidatus Dormibacteraeota bacterium]